MLKKERQIYILEKVKREGRAITNDLVEELGVAEDTIRIEKGCDFQRNTNFSYSSQPLFSAASLNSVCLPIGLKQAVSCIT